MNMVLEGVAFIYISECRNSFRMLTDKPTEKRPLGWLRLRWDENFRMDLKAIRVNTRNWKDTAQNRGS